MFVKELFNKFDDKIYMNKISDLLFKKHFKNNAHYRYGWRKLVPWSILNHLFKRKLRKRIENVFDQVRSLTPIKNLAYILLEDIYVDSDNKKDNIMSLFRRIDIEDDFVEYKELDDLLIRRFELIPTDELRRIDLNKFKVVNSFSYEFSPWEEIIGFPVYIDQDPSSEEYINSLIRILSEIVFEMTVWGWTNKSIKQQAEEMLKESNELTNERHKLLEEYDEVEVYPGQSSNGMITDDIIDDNQSTIQSLDEEVELINNPIYDYYPNYSDADVRAMFEMVLVSYSSQKKYKAYIESIEQEVLILPDSDSELYHRFNDESNKLLKENFEVYKELAK